MKKFVFQCPYCSHRLSASIDLIGKPGRCKHCKKSFVALKSLMETIPAPGSDSGRNRIIEEDESPIDWLEGDVILDMYEVRSVLGTGGMGRVFAVYHRQWDTLLAVKSPLASFFTDKRRAVAFQRECENWVQLGLHPHVATCYYVRVLGGVPRIFAEYVSGGSLQEAIDRRTIYAGESSLARVLTIGIQLAWGLSFAHKQGLVHSDIKPANVLLTDDFTAKVTDFGLAQARASLEGGAPRADESSVTAAGMTPGYCSPEQALCRKVTPASDIWSWALCLFESLNGERLWRYGPQASETISEFYGKGTSSTIYPGAPKKLIRLIAACCQDNPHARPQDILEPAAELAEIYKDITGKPFPLRAPEDVTHQPEYLNNRAVSLLDLGKCDQAMRQWEKALAVSPGHPDSVYNLGLVRWRRGEITDSEFVQSLAPLRHSDRGDRTVRTLIPLVHAERGDYREGLSALQGIEHHADAARLAPLGEYLASHAESSRGRYRRIVAHDDKINAVKISRNGRYAITASEDNTVKLWDLASGECVRNFLGHRLSVLAAHLSRKGEYALSGSLDRTVRLWNMATGACVQTMKGHTSAVTCVAISTERNLLVSGSEDRTIRLWRADEGECETVLRGHRGIVTSLTFHPKLPVILSGGGEGELRIWEPGNAETAAAVWQAHDGEVTCVCWSGCGRYLASAGMDGAIKLWDVSKQTCLRTLRAGSGPVMSVALTPDASHLVSSSTSGLVRLWETDEGRCRCSFDEHEAPVRSVDICGKGEHAVSADERGTLCAWRIAPDLAERPAPLLLSQTVRSEVAVDTQRKFQDLLLAIDTAFQDGKHRGALELIERARALPGYERNRDVMERASRLYTLLPRESIVSCWEYTDVAQHIGAVTCIESWGDGQRILTGGADGKLVLWNVAKQEIERLLEGHRARITCLDIDPRGRVAVSGSEDNALRVWSLETGECRRVLGEGAGLVHVEAVSLGPNPRFAVSGGMDVRLWDLESGRVLMTYSDQAVEAECLKWTPDGNAILVGAADGTVHMLDPADGSTVRVLSGGRGKVRALSISGDGRYLLCAGRHLWSTEADLRMWDLHTGECVRVFEGEIGSVSRLRLSFDARAALTVDDTGCAKIWDTQYKTVIASLTTKNEPLTAAGFTRNGSHAVAGSESGRMWLWQLDWRFGEHAVIEGVESHLNVFLRNQIPAELDLPPDKLPTADEIKQALTRRGKPIWGPQDLRALVIGLGCAGAGALPMARLDAILMRVAQVWGTPKMPATGWLAKYLGQP